RQQMRELRAQRRQAMREARSAGDQVALQAAQDEYGARVEALRTELQGVRGQVMEQRLSAQPELAEALGADARRSTAAPCQAGPGEASAPLRRRAFTRLAAMAPEGLAGPSDIPTPVRDELRTSARRVAVLRCIRVRAHEAGDSASATEVRRLIVVEQRRHDAALRALLGAPPATPAPRAAQGGAR